jgi:integrase/recombinase XerD
MGLRSFARYFKEKNMLNIEEVDFKFLQEYLEYTRTRPRLDGKSGSLSISTVNTYIKTLRGCFKYLYNVGNIQENPAEKIKYLKKKHSIIASFSAGQVNALVSAIPVNTFTGRRNRLLIRLLLDCGLRISEALGIRVKDVYYDEKLLKVTGKGNRERLIPFGEKTKAGFKRWIEENTLTDNDRVFFSTYRDSITTSAIRMFLRSYGLKAGLKGVRVSPHIFRHTFAVMFLRNGGNPFVLQRILGHSTLEMTQRYVNLLIEDLQREHEKYGPGDRFDF